MPRPSLSGAPRAILAVVARAALPSTLLLALSAAPASSQSGGTLTFTGTADAVDLGSPGVLLEFGQMRVDPGGNTGIFSYLNNNGRRGAAGSMQPFVVGSGAQSVSRVLHIGGYSFDLSFLPSGTYGQDECYVGPEVGQRCTPYQLPGYDLSPFYLENVAAAGSDAMFTAIVSFDVAGTVTGRGTTQAFTGTITSVFEGLSFQEALIDLEQHGLTDVPFTGTFVVGAEGTRTMMLASTSATVTPEPGTVALMGTGLAVLVVVGWRRRRPLRATARA